MGDPRLPSALGDATRPSRVTAALVHPPPASVLQDPPPARLPPALTASAPHRRSHTTAVLDRSRARPRLEQVRRAPHAGAVPTPAPFSKAPGAPTGRSAELRPPDLQPLPPRRSRALRIGYTRTQIQTLIVYRLIAWLTRLLRWAGYRGETQRAPAGYPKKPARSQRVLFFLAHLSEPQ